MIQACRRQPQVIDPPTYVALEWAVADEDQKQIGTTPIRFRNRPEQDVVLLDRTEVCDTNHDSGFGRRADLARRRRRRPDRRAELRRSHAKPIVDDGDPLGAPRPRR